MFSRSATNALSLSSKVQSVMVAAAQSDRAVLGEHSYWLGSMARSAAACRAGTSWTPSRSLAAVAASNTSLPTRRRAWSASDSVVAVAAAGAASRVVAAWAGPPTNAVSVTAAMAIGQARCLFMVLLQYAGGQVRLGLGISLRAARTGGETQRLSES